MIKEYFLQCNGLSVIPVCLFFPYFNFIQYFVNLL